MAVDQTCQLCGRMLIAGVEVALSLVNFVENTDDSLPPETTPKHLLCGACGKEIAQAIKNIENKKRHERMRRERYAELAARCGRWIFCDSEDWGGVADYKCPDCGAKHRGVDIYGPIPGVDCLKFCPECGESMEKQEDSVQQFTPEQIRDMETANQICKWYKEKLKERQEKLGKENEQ